MHIQAFTKTLKITVGCPPCTYPSIHVETLRITTGCLWSTYPSIHPSLDEDTLKITVGCPTSTYPSVRNKKLHSCWTPWSTRETRGLCARPPVLTPVPVPSQAIHSDIQSTAQKSPCVNTFFEAIAKKTRFVTVWLPGQDTNGHDNRETRHTAQLRQQRGDVYLMCS